MDTFNQKENEIAKKDLLKAIKEVSLFIGSRAWEVERNDSDYDYLIRHDKLQEIFAYIEKKYPILWRYKQMFSQSHGDSCDRESLREFYSIIINIDDKVYNIISPIDMINYRAWRSSANQMTKFIGDDLIKEKQNRVDIFELFKEMYRRKYTKKLTSKKSTQPNWFESDVPF